MASPQQPAPQDGGISDSGWSLVKTVFKRLLWHIFSLIVCGIVVFNSNELNQMGSSSTGLAFLLGYMGLISLVPRGNVKDHDWYIPVTAGCAQWAILAFLGFPLGVDLFVAGFQTWLIRVASKRWSLGWDKVVLPVDAILLVGLLMSDLGAYIEWLPLASFPVVFLAAFGLIKAFRSHHGAQIKKAACLEAVAALKKLQSEVRLPAELKQALLRLTAKLDEFIPGIDFKDQKDNEPIKLLTELSAETASYQAALRGKKNAFGIVKRPQAQDAGALDLASEALLEKTLNFESALTSLINARAPQKPKARDALSDYEDEADKLRTHKELLPDDLGKSVETIALCVYDMVRQMRADPADKQIGQPFLNRYLRFVSKIITEYERLSAEKDKSAELNDALERSKKLLERLAAAFESENKHMLDNDTVNFSAEINALDSFMKMHGQ